MRPYNRIRLAFLASELKLELPEVEVLLVEMIVDAKISGKIDQINGFLFLDGNLSTVKSKKYDTVSQWSEKLSSLIATLTTKAHI